MISDGGTESWPTPELRSRERWCSLFFIARDPDVLGVRPDRRRPAFRERIPQSVGLVARGAIGFGRNGKLERELLCPVRGASLVPSGSGGRVVPDQHGIHAGHLRQSAVRISDGSLPSLEGDGCIGGSGMLGGIAMTSHDLLVFRIGTALVLALGHAGIQQSYTLAADVLRGRETGNVMGVVSMVAGVFSYLGPQMLGLLRDWSGGFEAGWYFIIGAAAATLLLVLALWSYSSHQVRDHRRWSTAGALARGSSLHAQTAQPRWIEPGKGGMLACRASVRRRSRTTRNCECLGTSGHARPSIL